MENLNFEQIKELIDISSTSEIDDIIIADECSILKRIIRNIEDEENIEQNIELFTNLFEKASEQQKSHMISHENYQIFHSTISAGNFEFTKFLLTKFPQSSFGNDRIPDPFRAIGLAAEYCHDEILELLLQNTSHTTLQQILTNHSEHLLRNASNNYGATKFFFDKAKEMEILPIVFANSLEAMSYAASSGFNDVVKLYTEIAKELDRENHNQFDNVFDTFLGRLFKAENYRAFRYAAENNHSEVLETIFDELSPTIARIIITEPLTNTGIAADGGYNGAASKGKSEAINVIISQFLRDPEDHNGIVQLNSAYPLPQKCKIFYNVAAKVPTETLKIEDDIIVDKLKELRNLVTKIILKGSDISEEEALQKSNLFIRDLLEKDNLKQLKTFAEKINLSLPVEQKPIRTETFDLILDNISRNSINEDPASIFKRFSNSERGAIGKVMLDFFGGKTLEEMQIKKSQITPSNSPKPESVEHNSVDQTHQK